VDPGSTLRAVRGSTREAVLEAQRVAPSGKHGAPIPASPDAQRSGVHRDGALSSDDPGGRMDPGSTLRAVRGSTRGAVPEARRVAPSGKHGAPFPLPRTRSDPGPTVAPHWHRVIQAAGWTPDRRFAPSGEAQGGPSWEHNGRCRPGNTGHPSRFPGRAAIRGPPRRRAVVGDPGGRMDPGSTLRAVRGSTRRAVRGAQGGPSRKHNGWRGPGEHKGAPFCFPGRAAIRGPPWRRTGIA